MLKFFWTWCWGNGRRLMICKYFVIIFEDWQLWVTVTHRCDNVPQPVVVHSRSPLRRPPTILLGNHVLVKFNFIIITAEGWESLARGDVVAWDIRRYVEIVLSLVFLSGNDTAFWKRAKRRETAVPIFFSQVRPRLAISRTIDKFSSARVDDFDKTAMTSTGTPQDDSPLSLDFSRRNLRK